VKHAGCPSLISQKRTSWAFRPLLRIGRTKYHWTGYRRMTPTCGDLFLWTPYHRFEIANGTIALPPILADLSVPTQPNTVSVEVGIIVW
jgi:hypothetical protein